MRLEKIFFFLISYLGYLLWRWMTPLAYLNLLLTFGYLLPAYTNELAVPDNVNNTPDGNVSLWLYFQPVWAGRGNLPSFLAQLYAVQPSFEFLTQESVFGDLPLTYPSVIDDATSSSNDAFADTASRSSPPSPSPATSTSSPPPVPPPAASPRAASSASERAETFVRKTLVFFGLPEIFVDVVKTAPQVLAWAPLLFELFVRYVFGKIIFTASA